MAASPRSLVIPPHSVEAEQAVLGALMLEPSSWARIRHKLDSSDFYRSNHQVIFAAIRELHTQGRPVDALTVHEFLERRGDSDKTGGLTYLAELVRETPSAANIEAYADVVRDRAAKRGLLGACQRIGAAVVKATAKSAAELIADATQQIQALQAASRVGKGLVDAHTLTGELLDDLEHRRSQPIGLRIGLSDFDELSCGLEPGDLVVFAGRPGMGKTALLVSIAARVCETTGVGIFSAEMPAKQMMRRCLALMSGVPQSKLRRAERLEEQDWENLAKAAVRMRQARLWVDDTPAPTLEHIRAETVVLHSRDPLGLVLVDYCQLVRARGANRYEELREVSYGLKGLAKELAVPIILLAQLNRSVEARESKRPRLADLRDSGAIEEAADIVGLLYSEGYYDPDVLMPYVLECAIEKNRNGQRGECLWHFDGAISRVEPLSRGAVAEYRQLRARARRPSGDDL